MEGLAAQQPAHTPRLHLPTLVVHIAQIFLAVIVLGLAAYGVSYISYNILIYSLVVTVCSIGVSSWMIASRTVFTKLDNLHVSLGLHAWMLVFWVVNLGLTAQLAHEWNPQCSYTAEAGKICSTLAKRDTTFRTYFGALVASAVLIGLELLLWTSTTTLLALDLKRRRSTVSQAPPDVPTLRLSAETADEGDLEKQANPFDNVSAAPARDHAEPVLPPASPDMEEEPIEPYQPYFPNQIPQYAPTSLCVDAILTSPLQPEDSWSGVDDIDEFGSPIPLPLRPRGQFATNRDSRATSSIGTRRAQQA